MEAAPSKATTRNGRSMRSGPFEGMSKVRAEGAGWQGGPNAPLGGERNAGCRRRGPDTSILERLLPSPMTSAVPPQVHALAQSPELSEFCSLLEHFLQTGDGVELLPCARPRWLPKR